MSAYSMNCWKGKCPPDASHWRDGHLLGRRCACDIGPARRRIHPIPSTAQVSRYDLVLTMAAGIPWSAATRRRRPGMHSGLQCASIRRHIIRCRRTTPTWRASSFLGNRLPDREARVEEFFLRAATHAPEEQFLLGGNGWGDKPMPPNVAIRRPCRNRSPQRVQLHAARRPQRQP